MAIYGQLSHVASIDAIGVAKALVPAALAVSVLAQVIVRRHTRAAGGSYLFTWRPID